MLDRTIQKHLLPFFTHTALPPLLSFSLPYMGLSWEHSWRGSSWGGATPHESCAATIHAQRLILLTIHIHWQRNHNKVFAVSIMTLKLHRVYSPSESVTPVKILTFTQQKVISSVKTMMWLLTAVDHFLMLFRTICQKNSTTIQHLNSSFSCHSSICDHYLHYRTLEEPCF